MCKRFVDMLNKDIKLLVGILQLKEFVVLVDRACKAEELSKEKRKANLQAKDSRKRPMNKPYQSSSKKFRDLFTHPNVSIGHSSRDRGKQYSSPKAQATSVSSVGSVRNYRLECQQRGRRHPGECRMNNRACFKCGSQDHFIRDCPKLAEKDNVQNARPSNTATRGRPQKNAENASGNRGTTRDSIVRSDARAPAKAYAIRAREEASSPDVITDTFSLYDTNVIALIDPGSTHSYICMNLVFSKNLLVESTEFVIKYRTLRQNCPLMTRGYCFPTNFMLLPFDEFDIILGMNWLILHDTVRCVRKGCEAYLAYVLDAKVSESMIESFPIVCEYPDVFPEELPGLPPIRELVPGTSSISIAPYRMAPIELKELKSQLQELTNR
ncbi:Gag-Pol polyprotein [Gossypium australe]|uniref:Gag-Pol polyprotein n=1 Tax=Gossypium australe TaxID=47621 RepID=A0A5B6VWE5_9ROSI|nr:Gag-Pol polyprotein [Gossypium australe]